ncbi:site-specific integrase [Chryseobacterium culicis]|uniref:Site-specific recombinase XerD n=1 Tax=Chryseobacterium culicis TaxID=680127 RepID=A0A1H6IMZ9_CHRCI|nr:site-specific integrase [Chryseobacterium culicis]SEH47651.1 Site-specific recombinase XerD [Chryseobacterium culicis]
MLESSFGVNFFLKTPWKKGDYLRFVYLRITVDGISKEISTKRKWSVERWNQKTERAVGTKEDTKSLNHFLDSLISGLNNFRTKLSNNSESITAVKLIEYIQGKSYQKPKVLEEFQKHNEEMLNLVIAGDFARGTYDRYVTARSHVEEFMQFQYNRSDFEFRELNYSFVTDYEFYLKTVRGCSNNTTLKYIANFKKIVLRAIAKDIIQKDPFILFKSKKNKLDKRPLTTKELQRLEDKKFDSERLSIVRDIFVFQCYTGLSYIDVKQLRYSEIKEDSDGSFWIMSNRQKSKSRTDIPLLEKALLIMKRYQGHPQCHDSNLVLPVRSNQKMNEYLKEIATLCGIYSELNTHMARRTFASTVTLKNGVPINVVKELMGHHSVTQTEEYALTTQELINSEMNNLKTKLRTNTEDNLSNINLKMILDESEIQLLVDYERLKNKILGGII